MIKRDRDNGFDLINDASEYNFELPFDDDVRRQLSWPVDDNYLDRLSEAPDKGSFALRCYPLVWQEDHSISGEEIHEQSCSRRFARERIGQGGSQCAFRPAY
jgi:hypothetical protein